MLWSHRQEVLSSDPEDIYRIRVRHQGIWEDTLHQLRKQIPLTKYLKITFLGEPAVDAGGPLREFLYLIVLSASQNNSLFISDETSRAPAHNVAEVEKRTFYYVGVIMALSLVHGGPAPCFFTGAVVDFFLYGIEGTKPSVADVPHTEIRVKLHKVSIYIS